MKANSKPLTIFLVGCHSSIQNTSNSSAAILNTSHLSEISQSSPRDSIGTGKTYELHIDI